MALCKHIYYIIVGVRCCLSYFVYNRNCVILAKKEREIIVVLERWHRHLVWQMLGQILRKRSSSQGKKRLRRHTNTHTQRLLVFDS